MESTLQSRATPILLQLPYTSPLYYTRRSTGNQKMAEKRPTFCLQHSRACDDVGLAWRYLMTKWMSEAGNLCQLLRKSAWRACLCWENTAFFLIFSFTAIEESVGFRRVFKWRLWNFELQLREWKRGLKVSQLLQ